MKRNIILVLLGLMAFCFFYKCTYKPYSMRKNIKIEAQKLRLGSYIFSTSMGYNGSQSRERKYYIFKVTQIKDDYVRLAVVRKFYGSQKMFDVRISPFDGYFSATKEVYEDAKKTIENAIVTLVESHDINNSNNLILTDSLRLKYPALLKSRLYVEDISKNIKPTTESPIYGDKMLFFSLVYSKNEIMSNAQLVPYLDNARNDDKIRLEYGYSKDIDKIINLR